MKFLFFFVHPSKFHVFRNTINALLNNQHDVEILITNKDVLVDLVENEGWNYTNIFPEGRKIKGIPAYISSAINLVRTIYRLFKHTWKKKYDLFITDDLLVYIGKIKNIPTIVFSDDDLKIVKAFSIILKVADYCLAPTITDLGKYNNKKIAFNSYKELAYLHPNHFKPDSSVLKELTFKNEKFFILRLVHLKSYHDFGISGLNNIKVRELIDLLEPYGRVLITAERKLPNEFEKYRIKIHPSKLIHLLSFADIFIGDSQTMSSEACILGVPTFRLNDFAGKISVMEEKGDKYELMESYKSKDFSLLIQDLKLLLKKEGYKEEYKNRKNKMLSEKIDLSQFLIWLFENFPQSVEKLKDKPDFQYKFK